MLRNKVWFMTGTYSALSSGQPDWTDNEASMKRLQCLDSMQGANPCPRALYIILRKMLTEKQQKAFVEFYKSLYWDTSKKTWTWELPHIPANKEEEHIKMWNDFLIKLIWPRKAKRVYKVRPYGPETVLHKVFSSLWLNYWPVIDWKKFN